MSAFHLIATNRGRCGTSVSGRKHTLGNDGLLRCRSRFFDQSCHLACVREKDCVAAGKLNDLRLRPLRHESLEVGVDHPILFGDHGVARFLFPGGRTSFSRLAQSEALVRYPNATCALQVFVFAFFFFFFFAMTLFLHVTPHRKEQWLQRQEYDMNGLWRIE